MKRRDFLWTVGCAGLTVPFSREAAAAVPCPPPAATVVGGSSATTTCTPGDTSPAPAGLPQYMAGMSDFQVNHLTSVSGGTVTMYATLPPEWQTTGQPNGADNVFAAWSGGVGDPTGMRLFVHGGGHNDSSNNGLYVYDFRGTTAPAGWSVAPSSLSALSAVAQSVNTYTDGRPTAIHSYNQLWYDPNSRRFYRFSGSGFGPGGGAISAAFYYDFATEHWVPLLTDSRLGAPGLGSSLVGSPDGSTLLYLSSCQTPIFVNATTGIATGSGSAVTGSEESGFVTALDTKRSSGPSSCRYVAFYYNQSGPSAMIITVNWPANSFSITKQALSGVAASDLNDQGSCVVYDAVRDSFWVFAPETQCRSGQISSIYEVNASTFAVVKNALSTPIPCLTINSGGYNKCVWFQNWRIIGTVHQHDQPMSLIKLPS